MPHGGNHPAGWLDKIEFGEGCWPWTGFIYPSGYGQYGARRPGREVLAHRLVYQESVGSIPTGMVLDHICHNEALDCSGGDTCLHRRCVNPDHLEPITQSEHALRGVRRPGYGKLKTHCRWGHELSPDNTHLEADGYRACRECRRIGERRRYWERKKAAA